jgi:Uma2 family endonuclease
VVELTLERPTAAARHRFDVDAYYRMAEAGILARNDRVELLGGEIVDMAPIGSAHSGKINRLAAAFGSAFVAKLCVVSVQNPLRLDRFNEPQPDLMVLRYRDDFYERGHPTAADMLLLVEVADSSLAYDRGAKLTLYARHDVAEVWIVDIAGHAVEVCREPVGDAYTRRQTLTSGAIGPALVPGIEIELDELLR